MSSATTRTPSGVKPPASPHMRSSEIEGRPISELRMWGEAGGLTPLGVRVVALDILRARRSPAERSTYALRMVRAAVAALDAPEAAKAVRRPVGVSLTRRGLLRRRATTWVPVVDVDVDDRDPRGRTAAQQASAGQRDPDGTAYSLRGFGRVERGHGGSHHPQGVGRSLGRAAPRPQDVERHHADAERGQTTRLSPHAQLRDRASLDLRAAHVG